MYSKTREKYEELKKYGIDKKTNKLFTIFFEKYHKTNIDLLYKRLQKCFGNIITIDIVECVLQDIYFYMMLQFEYFLKLETSQDIYCWYCKIVNSPRVIGQTWHKIKYLTYEYPQDCPDKIPNTDECWGLNNLDFRLPNRERLFYHYNAISEIYEYIQNYPDSILSKSLELCDNDELYNVAINYAATPNMEFLKKNMKTLKLSKIQENVNKYKKIVSQLVGKQPKTHCIFRW